MKKYRVLYYFDGTGEVEIEAKSPEEATEKFRSGDYDYDKEIESGENYCFDEVIEIKD